MKMKHMLGAMLAGVLTLYQFAAMAQTQDPENAPDQSPAPVAQTPEHLGEMILQLDSEAQQDGNAWTFTIEDVGVTLIYDTNADRMRLITAITDVAGMTQEQFLRLMQANFDSALDARYAVAQNIVWSTFIHPLGSLTDEEFLSGIGQTVNLALTYGTTFSSGALVFGGGDSQDLYRRQLIDRLLEQGQKI